MPFLTPERPRYDARVTYWSPFWIEDRHRQRLKPLALASRRWIVRDGDGGQNECEDERCEDESGHGWTPSELKFTTETRHYLRTYSLTQADCHALIVFR
jgi:hypothetical protein